MSNNRHPVQNWHLTFRGHYTFSVPPGWTRLFRCYETSPSGVDHTHVGVFYQPGITFKNLLLMSKALLRDAPQAFRDQEPDLKAHQTFNSIIGYHYGEGDKPRCSPAPIWENEVFNYEAFSRKRFSKKSTQVKNATLLNEDSITLVNEGIISLLSKPNLSKAKASYASSQAKKEILPDVQFLSGKQRHLWVFDVPSSGKTAMCLQLKEKASVYWKDLTDEKFWENYTGAQFIIFNDFAGSIPLNSIKSWTDGSCIVSIKGGFTTLHKQPIFIITANKSMEDTFAAAFTKSPSDLIAMRARFLEVTASDLYSLLHDRFQLVPAFP